MHQGENNNTAGIWVDPLRQLGKCAETHYDMKVIPADNEWIFQPQTSTRSYLRVVGGGRSRSRQFLRDPAEFVVHFSPEGRGKGVFLHTIDKLRALLPLQSRENDVMTGCPHAAGVKCPLGRSTAT